MVKYIKISNILRDHILKDRLYSPGDQLPCERELCETYDSSKMTIKKALDILVDEGLIYKKRGQGTFVKDLSPQQLLNLKATAVQDSMVGFNKKYQPDQVTSNVVEFTIIPAPSETAVNLRINPGDFVYKIIRIRNRHKIPCVLEETYMPIDLIPGLKQPHLEQSIYGYIREQLHYEIQSAHVKIRIHRADTFTARHLRIDPGSPVSRVEQVAFLDNGKPFEHSFSTHTAESFEFSAVIVKKN